MPARLPSEVTSAGLWSDDSPSELATFRLCIDRWMDWGPIVDARVEARDASNSSVDNSVRSPIAGLWHVGCYNATRQRGWLSGSVAETQAREAPVVARTGSKEAGRRAVTLLEGRGATPGPSRCCEFTSVVSRSQTSGKLVPLVRYLGIHRLFCDRDSAVFVRRLCPLHRE